MFIHRSVYIVYCALYARESGLSGLTPLWRVESRPEAVEELIKAQFPVSILIRQLDEGIHTQTPVEHTTVFNILLHPFYCSYLLREKSQHYFSSSLALLTPGIKIRFVQITSSR